MPYLYSGKMLREGRSFKDNDGTLHPATWATAWSDEEKAAKGLVWVDPAPTFDSRFYWSAGVEKNIEDVAEVDVDGNPVLDEDGVQVITKGLKSNAIALVKTQAGGLLAPTDWMVIKSQETGEGVPDDVLAYRAEVRLASNTIEDAIIACATLDEFKALYETPVDAEGNVTGNAPITNWPEAI